jgi:hypothetical protein
MYVAGPDTLSFLSLKRVVCFRLYDVNIPTEHVISGLTLRFDPLVTCDESSDCGACDEDDVCQWCAAVGACTDYAQQIKCQSKECHAREKDRASNNYKLLSFK